MENINETILAGVGKNTRSEFEKGNLSKEQVLARYAYNKKVCDSYMIHGRTRKELEMELRYGNPNPLLRIKLEEAISSYDERALNSSKQNELNFEKLEAFEADAWGVELRKGLKKLKREVRRTKDFTLEMVTLFLETEYANLCAKLYSGNIRKRIYERKSILLQRISILLSDTDWRYGFNCTTGKNADYLLFVYLPNGNQITWHCNDYNVASSFPYINDSWDGQIAQSMTKIVNYISDNYRGLMAA